MVDSSLSKRTKAPRYTTDLLKTPGMAFDISIEDPKERIQCYIDAYRNAGDGHKGIDEDFMRYHIQIQSASLTNDGRGARAVFRMKNSPTFSNRMGNMHGGAVAMIFDMCTTMCAAPLATKDFWIFGGVSRTLSVTFLRPVREGVDLTIECEVLQQGQRLSTIRGVMRDGDGSVLSVAEHNKARINFVPPLLEDVGDKHSKL